MNIFNNKKLNILVLGSDGMLGYDVYEHFKKLSALNNSNIGIVTGITKNDGIDVSKRYSLSNFFQKSIHYDYCINCIAYTDTYKAEHDKQGFVDSYILNALAPEFIATSCYCWKVKLIHISTDYVFSEYSINDSADKTYKAICSVPFPINVYGTHKLLGEYGIAKAFKNKKEYCILRTSWLYGMHNSKSFIHKFMRNVVKACMNTIKDKYSEESISIDVNNVEQSIPTSTLYVVDCIENVIRNNEYGIIHAVPTLPTSGIIPSRYDFAKEILKYYDGTIVNDIDLAHITLNSVSIDDGYWPKFSAMTSSFSWSANWQEPLERFINKNKNKILEFAIKENTK